MQDDGDLAPPDLEAMRLFAARLNIEREWTTDRSTGLDPLSRKYGVPFATVQLWANEGKWRQKRKRMLGKKPKVGPGPEHAFASHVAPGMDKATTAHPVNLLAQAVAEAPPLLELETTDLEAYLKVSRQCMSNAQAVVGLWLTALTARAQKFRTKLERALADPAPDAEIPLPEEQDAKLMRDILQATDRLDQVACLNEAAQQRLRLLRGVRADYPMPRPPERKVLTGYAPPRYSPSGNTEGAAAGVTAVVGSGAPDPTEGGS